MIDKVPDKEAYKIRDAAKHEVGQFDMRAWMALSRLLGLHYPFSDIEKVDLLTEVKTKFVLGGSIGEDSEL
jgi:hypothetical protein